MLDNISSDVFPKLYIPSGTMDVLVLQRYEIFLYLFF